MNKEQTVVVVDDDPGVRDSLSMLLDSVGLDYRLYANAKDFLQEVDEIPPLAPHCEISFFYTPEIQKGSPGNDLLSQGPASQVPSALEGLTTWFGMEQGVSPPLELPEEPLCHCQLPRTNNPS